MTISKKSVIHIIAFIWIIFSVGYIGWDTWRDFKLRVLNQAYQQGRVDTINALIGQAQQCSAIPITSGTTTISVVNVDCLQTQAETGK